MIKNNKKRENNFFKYRYFSNMYIDGIRNETNEQTVVKENVRIIKEYVFK